MNDIVELATSRIGIIIVCTVAIVGIKLVDKEKMPRLFLGLVLGVLVGLLALVITILWL